MNKLDRTKLEHMIRSTKGKFFSVEFTKQDGSLRKMTCQLVKPKKDAKRASPAKLDNPYILVRDIKLYSLARLAGKTTEQANDASYRLINLSNMTKLVCQRATWYVDT